MVEKSGPTGNRKPGGSPAKNSPAIAGQSSSAEPSNRQRRITAPAAHPGEEPGPIVKIGEGQEANAAMQRDRQQPDQSVNDAPGRGARADREDRKNGHSPTSQGDETGRSRSTRELVALPEYDRENGPQARASNARPEVK